MKLLFENFRKFVHKGGFSGNGPLAEPIEEAGYAIGTLGVPGGERGGPDPHTAALENIDNYLFKNAHVYEDDLARAFHELNTSVIDYEDKLIGQDEFLQPEDTKEKLAQDVANNLSKFSIMVAETEDKELNDLLAAASKLIGEIPNFLKEKG